MIECNLCGRCRITVGPCISDTTFIITTTTTGLLPATTAVNCDLLSPCFSSSSSTLLYFTLLEEERFSFQMVISVLGGLAGAGKQRREEVVNL